MGNAVSDFFSSNYMPHGHCYLWKPEILWLNVLSDLTIALAYFSIPIALFYFIRKREDLRFKGIFILFSLFIAFCGITHLIGIYVVWHGSYGIHGLSKLLTALISVLTACYLLKSIPSALSIPSPSQLKKALEEVNNEKLKIIKADDRIERDRILRESMECSNIGVAVCNTQGIIKITNDALCRIFGYKPAELENFSIDLLLNVGQQANHQGNITDFMTGTINNKIKSSSRKIMGQHKNGHQIPLEITLNKGQEGTDPVVYASIVDLTERLAIKEKLLESNRRFERITAAAKEGLWEFNIVDNCVWLSPRCFVLLGFNEDEQEVTIENLLSFVATEDRDLLTSYIYDPSYPRDVRYIEFQMLHKDGHYQWFSTQAGNIANDSGDYLFRSGAISDINDKKGLTKELAEQQQKHRSIVEKLPLGIHLFSMDQAGKMIFVDSNPAADKILNINNNELYGLDYETAFPAIKGTDFLPLLRSAAVDNVTSKHETISYEDGNISGVFSSTFLQLTPGHAITLFEDVSERRAAQKSLEESEQFIKRALNTSFTGIYIYNLQSQTSEYINLAFTQILGYNRDEVNEMTIDERKACFHDDDVGTVFSQLEQLKYCTDTEKVFEVEYRFKHRLGHWIWCLSKKSVFEFDELGKAKSFIGSFLDITARKEAEQSLTLALRKLNLSMQGSHDGFWHLKDPEQELLDWSNSCFEMLGYQAQEFEPSVKMLLDMLHPDDVEGTVKAIKQAIESKTTFDIEHRIADKNNNYRWYRGKGAPYYNDGVFIEMAGSLSDIDAMKDLQSELLRSNQELEQFSYIASHDLKEPLRTIRTFVDYLLQDVKSGDQQRMKEDASYITSACERMAHLIEALLALSRAGAKAFNVEKCNLDSILKQVETNLKIQIQESSTIINVVKKLPIIVADKLQLELVFQNLIQNAIKFSKEGCVPQITIDFDDQVNEDFIELYISDDGIGIDDKKLNEIFGAFKKLHSTEDYPGTGIGLAIVEKIIKRLGGSIRVESSVMQGATFIIQLPNISGVLINE
jgi:PAS domain S-box-containing protein